MDVAMVGGGFGAKGQAAWAPAAEIVTSMAGAYMDVAWLCTVVHESK